MTKKKYTIIASLAILITLGGVAASPPGMPATPPADPAKNDFTNLKVLPRDISPKKLQQIMVDEFNDGLGVGCGFCHAEKKGSHALDYASDAKPEKQMARSMLRMTQKINRNFFHIKGSLGDGTLVVTCTTCHNRQPRPEGNATE